MDPYPNPPEEVRGQDGRSRRNRSFSALVALVLLTAASLACIRQARPLIGTPFVAFETTRGSGSTPAPNPTLGASVPGATSTPTATIFQDEPAQPRSRYSIQAEMDYDAHQVSVEQIVEYVNRSTDALPELQLVIEPLRVEGAFELSDFLWGEGDGEEVPNYTLEDGYLRAPLPEPLPPGRALQFSLRYRLQLPPAEAPFGYTERQANLSNWYPFVPPYRSDQGWLIHEPTRVAIGEHLVYPVADYDVAIRLIDPDPGLTIAASGLPERQGDWERYHLPAARNFSWSVSPSFESRAETVGDVTVTSYFFEEDRFAGEAALQAATDALLLFSDRFAPYPRKSLSVVEADFPDGLEFDGLFFLGRGYYTTYPGGPQNFLTTLAAHETAHQWWYAWVGNDQAMEPWLDEALTTYSERLYYETYHPDLVDWWWAFRVDLYEPTGWVDSTIYDHEGFRPYVNAVYLRGAQFLEAVRERAGEKAFFSALETYLEQNALSQGSGESLLALLEGPSGEGVGPLRDAFFSGNDPSEPGGGAE
jgi:hypothetical protein